MHAVYLLTGSNQGDRAAQLSLCREALAEQAGTIVQASAVYETAAWGLEDLPAHLNQALLLHTSLEPLPLLALLQRIEQALGRVRQEKWGIRAIDIDIIYFDDLVLNLPQLIIPHPLMQQRNFVLQPLAAIAPDYVHPLLHKNNRVLAAESADRLPVTPLTRQSA